MDETSKKIVDIFKNKGFKPPRYEELLDMRIGPTDGVKKAYKYLVDSKVLIDVGEGAVFHNTCVTQAKEKLIAFLKKNMEIKVSEFRDIIGASRKFALPLLIYFDTHGITIKRGEVRVLGQKYRTE
jgi:selenocysteine-specific elongation factor